MNIKIFCSFLALLLFISVVSARDIELTGRFIPPAGKTYIFGGQNNADSDSFVKINKRVPFGFMIYTPLSTLDGLEKDVDFGAGKTSGRHILKKYPGAALQIGLYLVGDLQAVIDGDFNENIIKFADWIKKAGIPIFLRIGYEFDYPANGYEPELYIKAYKIIVDKFDELEVKNVSYVWHSYASMNPRGIEAWYPGDEYVDWCAISYFESPQWIPMLKFSQKHNKPLMIAECAPMLGSYLKPERKFEWYEKLFRFIEKYDVKALCYINTDWNKLPMFANYNWGNSRLDASKEIKKFWLGQMSDERFVFRKQ
ncbi:MAG: glycoside hydrolase family 26 protein [Endomicrobia bacterium]|nr:glycoside hydrolase family 26 protein [Endomicrobiia bacterium]MCL2506986.1 glycoside hydrolase family 26 protein [Endomicrobiia bacterium]